MTRRYVNCLARASGCAHRFLAYHAVVSFVGEVRRITENAVRRGRCFDGFCCMGMLRFCRLSLSTRMPA